MNDIGNALVEVLDAFLAAVVRKAHRYAAIEQLNADLKAGRVHVHAPTRSDDSVDALMYSWRYLRGERGRS